MKIIYGNNDNFDELIAEGITLVDFYADWCGPCQALSPILEEVSEATNEFKIIKMDVDQAQDVAGKFSVMSIPTMLIFKDGEKIDQKVGVMQKEEIITWLESKK